MLCVSPGSYGCVECLLLCSAGTGCFTLGLAFRVVECLQALDRYRATESDQARRLLDTADRPVLEVLREWMLWLVTCPPDGESGRGCFVVNTATELGTSDDEVHRQTEAAFEVTRQAPRSALAEGRDRGELPDGLDTDGAAELLFTTFSAYGYASGPATASNVWPPRSTSRSGPLFPRPRNPPDSPVLPEQARP